MDPSQLILVVVLLVMVALFFGTRLSIDLTAFLGLAALLLCGLVTSEQAFSGVSSPAVVTMFSTFFIGAGLQHTGLTTRLAKALHRRSGNNASLKILAVIVLSVCTSAFMNNIAAVAILLPVVNALAAQAALSPSYLMMPLAFGVLLGGMLTEIGTSSNMVASEVLRESGLAPFSFFDFTLLGSLMAVAGGAYLVWAARALLPERSPVPRGSGTKSLSALYRLHERIFRVKIPAGAALSGRTLGETDFGGVLGVRVLAAERGGAKIMFPGPEQVLVAEDELIVGGRLHEFERLLWLEGVRIEPAGGEISLLLEGSQRSAVARVSGEGACGRTLQELKFHEQTGLLVVAVSRASQLILHDLSTLKLQNGDGLHVLGQVQDVERLHKQAGLSVSCILPEYDKLWQESLFTLTPREGSPLFGRRLSEVGLGEVAGLTVAGILRQGQLQLAPAGEEEIHCGDKLLVAGELERLRRLAELGELKVQAEAAHLELEGEGSGPAEVLISPRSRLIGKTLRELNFRERYGLHVLAVWKDGRPVRAHFEREELEFGNALLLHGSRAKINLLAEDPNFISMSGIEPVSVKAAKGAWVLLALALMVGLGGFGVLPVHVAAFMAALLVVVSGATSMEQVYHQIEWRVLFMVAALLPLGTAIESTGLAGLGAKYIIAWVGPYGPYLLLLVFCLLSSVLSQILDGAVAVVILGPLAVQAAQNLKVSPHTMMMGIALSASIAFLTPFSSKSNLLVMAPGGYLTRDFLKVGLGMTLITGVILVLVLPLLPL
ncbi:MAG: hypothetical protein GX589_08245 [Deltaproteobacteria bacterium]|nr:hypothetical protein [Deltaproteobacteria bacterium]